jgi:hypothetical protein
MGDSFAPAALAVFRTSYHLLKRPLTYTNWNSTKRTTSDLALAIDIRTRAARGIHIIANFMLESGPARDRVAEVTELFDLLIDLMMFVKYAFERSPKMAEIPQLVLMEIGS